MEEMVDKFSNNYNYEDHPELNSYDTGPGSNLGQNLGKENTKLYVANIPPGLSEEGLMNIFSSEGDIPENVYIHKKLNVSSKFSWGFVTFKNVSSAQTALFAINKRPPYHFYVKFAKSDADKTDSIKEKHNEDRSNINDKEWKISPSTRGRGKLAPMSGNPPSAFKASSIKDEPYIQHLLEDYSPGRFSHCHTTYEQNISNSVFSPYADGEYDDGKRRMSMGRGCYVAHRNGLVNKSINDETSMKHLDLEHKVSAYLGNKSKDLIFNNDAVISSKTKLSLPINPGNCTYCSRPSIYICSKCKSWYCTNLCHKKHWNVHKSYCKPCVIKFQDGNPVISQLSDDAIVENCDGNSQENNIVGIGTEKFCLRNGSIFYEGKKEIIHKNTICTENSPKIQSSKKLKNELSNLNDDITVKNKQNNGKIPQRNYKKLENEVCIRSPAPLEQIINNSQNNEEQELDDFPIPCNVFTKVTISSLKSDGEFYAYKVDDFTKQGNIMVRLNKYCKNNNSSDFEINVGTKCIAPFEGDRYRVEILEVYTEKVLVLYIDFGNENLVMKSELEKLPDEMSAETPLAYKFVLDSSLTNPKLEVDMVIAIRPIFKDMRGRWVARAEGINYAAEIQEVTISVTESKDVYWVHKKESILKVISMATALGQHKHLLINKPSIDHIYVHFCNSSWCRAKVISINPLKIHYIDYGNNCIIQGNELHPLPKTYENIPPLVFKIKLVPGTSPDYYDLKTMTKLYIKEVTKMKDGTAVCHVQSKDCQFNKQVNHFLSLLKNNEFATLQIEKVMTDEFFTASIMDSSSSSIPVYSEISKIIAEHVVQDDDFNPIPGSSVAAKWNDEWYRGYMMITKDKYPIVALVDKGRVVVPQEVTLLPHKVSCIPECGVQVILEKPIYNLNRTGDKVIIRNIRHDYDNNEVKGDTEEFGKVIMMPWVPSVEEAGLDCVEVTSGSKVQISSYHSPSAIYIQSCEPQLQIICKEILQDVASYTEGKNLNRKPLIGEYLACRYIEDGYYYRAQVFAKEGDKYKVNFVDYGNTELVSCSELKYLPEHFKKVPCCSVKVGLKDVPNIPFNIQCIKFLNELAANWAEMFLTYEKDLKNVTLHLRDGVNVNKVLCDLLEPSWNKPDYNPYSAHSFLGTEMKYETWPQGKKFLIAVASVINYDKILAMRPGSDLANHIDLTLTPMITKYCESLPNDQYNPRRSEVCLAKFYEDEKWYRAMCLKAYQHNAAQVFYLDYGNHGEVLFRCIRKMVPEFMETPSLLKFCKIYGMPANVDESVASKLKQYLSSLKTEAEVIKEEESEISVLRIPALETYAAQLGISISTHI